MSGIDPESKRAKDRDTPGPARCFALLYSGENSIDMIRKKLGATNPGEAEEGSVRADYGRDVMKNGSVPSRLWQGRESDRCVQVSRFRLR